MMPLMKRQNEERLAWLPVGHGEAVLVQEFGHGRPVCSFIAGVHGDEREGVVALIELANQLGRLRLDGTVRLVPVANPPAYHALMRTSPRDGLNLARVFPGNSIGTVTERIAAALTDNVIAGSDLLVDLHSAGSQWSMPFFVGYNATNQDLEQRAHEAAAAFGPPLIWRHGGGAPGRSLSAAADLGIPSIYVETEGGNRIMSADVNAYVEGCIEVLASLGIVESIAKRSGPTPKVVPGGSGDLDSASKVSCAASVAGHLITVAQPGCIVDTGDPLFRIYSEVTGETIDEYATSSGIVMAVRRSTYINAGDPLAIIAPTPVGLETLESSDGHG